MTLLILGLACGVLSAGGAAAFRLRGDDAFRRWTGRGATTARMLWACYLALCAWMIGQGSWWRAWAACVPGEGSPWSYVVLAAQRGATDLLPALCRGVGDARGLDGVLWDGSVPLAPVLALAIWLGSIGGWWQSLDLGTHEGTLARDLPMHSLRGLVFTLPPALVLWWFALGSPWPLLVVGVLCGPIYYACLLISRRRWTWQAGPAGEWAFGGAYAAALLYAVAFRGLPHP